MVFGIAYYGDPAAVGEHGCALGYGFFGIVRAFCMHMGLYFLSPWVELETEAEPALACLYFFLLNNQETPDKKMLYFSVGCDNPATRVFL